MKKDGYVSPSMEGEKFIRTKKFTETKCDIIINMTTSGELNKIGEAFY